MPLGWLEDGSEASVRSAPALAVPELADLPLRMNPVLISSGEDVVLATIDAYEGLSGRRLLIERVMAWNVLTVLGDALWRTEAGVALPGGGTVAGWVDGLQEQLAALRLG